ncbi:MULTISPECIES: LysR family transcriptional regulator [Ensifer]|jgi:DNA-binding transcriptional LysR family regulator|uniref:LysR family transcriptional regulator n=1 Tax=Ensifer canadensis TaxID=555315 RepID=A0AAW4FKA1_9HYPH|nr:MULTISPECIES: LysR family transcriptional regulator [Ensifer]MDP9633363.1 DNA-binding transcriptional LysR family regulator [Ensifer adhaerens]KQW60280.1 LysR family transcriptional regulator [Ensifer sp. Root1252]KQW70292.1 LysR family transcriptional regulator [Ensifer sp. Root127]KQY73533.1 LysR family transcriptional regulator [Ensifer sp. Root142]KRC76051.1 LysR family transcriptional regulator [Ensifer sp. Root231]
MSYLNGVSVFVEAADAGGFSAAAERLNLSRSAVGKTVAKLEQRLGVRLFHRTTRTQSLTDEGQLFYENCQRALSEIRAGEALLESGKQEIQGRLRLSMPVHFGRQCIMPLLSKLLQQHPRLEFDLNFSDRNVDLVEDGFDLAIRTGPQRDEPELMMRKIADQRMTVCASPAYIEANGAPETIEDLTAHQAILYRRSGQPLAWSFPVKAGQTQTVTPPARLRLDDLTSIADAAADGFGIAWLPCWLVGNRIASGSLVQILADVPALSYGTYVVWPKTQYMPPKLRLLIDTLAARLPPMME